MATDNILNNQGADSSYTTGDSSAPGPSRAPRQVQWVSKPQVEHVEQISHSEFEGEELEDHQGTLDEQGSDVSSCLLERFQVSLLLITSFI